MTTLTAPLKWHGGKAYQAKHIRAHFPPRDTFTRYCEPFAGGLAVMLAGDGDGVAEYANDLHCDLTNFWRVLSDAKTSDQFMRLVNMVPLSKEVFDEAANASHGLSDIGRAIDFFIRARQSRQGLMRDYTTPTSRLRRGINEQVSAWLSAVDGLADVHARLRQVEIYNLPAVDFIRKMDSPATFYYCDPPYLHETRVTTSDYAHEMSRSEHDALLNVLEGIKGRFLLSGYPSDCYEAARLRNGWHVVTKEIDNKASSAKVKQKKTECLWANYELKGAA